MNDKEILDQIETVVKTMTDVFYEQKDDDLKRGIATFCMGQVMGIVLQREGK